MTRSPEEQTVVENFARTYRVRQAPVMMQLERQVCGCDFGATSWTTREEAEELARLLGLGPGKRYLDVGSGSGWPALYLADVSGCDATLVDMPVDALRIARDRADGEGGMRWMAAGDGASLPFRGDCFDAIGHSDVLCCLPAKLDMLRECRRVLRPGGIMVFTVIRIASGLSGADYERAAESGPPFVKADGEYPDLLRQSGWQVEDCTDVTDAYTATLKRCVEAEELHADDLVALLGETEFDERMSRRRRAVRGIEADYLRREIFITT
jgi:SAM-dependent methyltransferase